jgi:hypothetical protein
VKTGARRRGWVEVRPRRIRHIPMPLFVLTGDTGAKPTQTALKTQKAPVLETFDRRDRSKLFVKHEGDFAMAHRGSRARRGLKGHVHGAAATGATKSTGAAADRVVEVRR